MQSAISQQVDLIIAGSQSPSDLNSIMTRSNTNKSNFKRRKNTDSSPKNNAASKPPINSQKGSTPNMVRQSQKSSVSPNANFTNIANGMSNQSPSSRQTPEVPNFFKQAQTALIEFLQLENVKKFEDLPPNACCMISKKNEYLTDTGNGNYLNTLTTQQRNHGSNSANIVQSPNLLKVTPPAKFSQKLHSFNRLIANGATATAGAGGVTNKFNNAYIQQQNDKIKNIQRIKKEIEDLLVYQALREQKKSELMMKMKELRQVDLKEIHYDALIRLYDLNISKYYHYNPETLPFTFLGVMLIFIGNIFINLMYTKDTFDIAKIEEIIPQKVAMNTVLSCSASGILNCFISYRKSQTEVFDLIAGLNGLIVGYVSIASCAHNVESWCSLVIGAIGSVLQEFFRRTLKRLDIDDPMDSISTHGMCGLWSLIALGIFDNFDGLIFSGNAQQLGVQLIGASSLILLSITLSILFFYPLK
mmetsp:Transcript_10646/g.17889  ORF Transcript_10646/g.17889 Transcript_10646/m.17889 type:complete len:473 (+) Transcript_10646:484-1902(+)